jgi:LPXTG-motif cell wall-anchored protein
LLIATPDVTITLFGFALAFSFYLFFLWRRKKLADEKN